MSDGSRHFLLSLAGLPAQLSVALCSLLPTERTRGSVLPMCMLAPLTNHAFFPTCRQVTKEEYGRLGGPALGERLAAQLREERGLNPCIIPVGGSSATGCWGYLEMAAELQRQQQELAAAAAGTGEAGPGGQGFFTDVAMVS